MSREIRFDDHSRQQVEFTTCYMCACRCGIKVTLEDGKIRFIQGNRNHPVNQRRALRQGRGRHHEAVLPGEACASRCCGGQEASAGGATSSRSSGTRRSTSLTRRLAKIRATDPTQLAFFTGRDQMQALSGLWAQQFGTPNWAAHGGFCSVNMAVAGLYTIGYSFWEFGAPDWDRAKYFMLWGVAEDHSSNPIKIGLDEAEAPAARSSSRSTRCAPATRRSPTSGCRSVPAPTACSRSRSSTCCSSAASIDWEFLIEYTNAPWLVVQTPGIAGDGLFARDGAGNPLVWDPHAQRFENALLPEIAPALLGDGRPARRPARQDGVLAHDRALSRPSLRARDRRRRVRSAGRDDPPHRAGDGAGRVRAGDRAADPVDRHARAHARQSRRPAGRDVRDARHLRAFERLPDLPRAAPAADAARRARRARQLPRARAVSAPHPDPHAAGERPGGDLRAEHAAQAARPTATRRGPRSW